MDKRRSHTHWVQSSDTLYEHPQRVPVISVLALTELRNIRIERDERVGCAEVQRVVDAPINLSSEKQRQRNPRQQ